MYLNKFDYKFKKEENSKQPTRKLKRIVLTIKEKLEIVEQSVQKKL